MSVAEKILPLGYVAPAIGSRAMIPSSLVGGWLEVDVLEVVPHVGSRLPEVVGAPVGSLSASFRSTEWRALGAVQTRCGICYAVVPEAEEIAAHAATSPRHARIAQALGVRP